MDGHSGEGEGEEEEELFKRSKKMGLSPTKNQSKMEDNEKKLER